MNGTRVWANYLGQLRLPVGGYGRCIDGGWRARPPGCNAEDLRSYHITEHQDETITVKQTILVNSVAATLTRGVWTAY